MKSFYKSLFSIKFYKEVERKPLWKASLYFVLVTIVMGLFIGFCKSYSVADELKSELTKVYEDIPEFTLSSKGFKTKENKSFEFEFAGVNVYVDTNKKLSDLIVEDAIDKSVSGVFIGKDGYGEVRGTVLERGGYFKEAKALEGVELTKKDFNIFQDILKIHGRTMLATSVISIIVTFMINSFVSMMCMSLCVYIFTAACNCKVNFKKAIVISLYLTTVYAVGSLVIFFIPISVSNTVYSVLMACIMVFYVYLITKQKVLQRGESNEQC